MRSKQLTLDCSLIRFVRFRLEQGCANCGPRWKIVRPANSCGFYIDCGPRTFCKFLSCAIKLLSQIKHLKHNTLVQIRNMVGEVHFFDFLYFRLFLSRDKKKTMMHLPTDFGKKKPQAKTNGLQQSKVPVFQAFFRI